jgi:chromate reductase, NAD(P)H dehydrogenase (quinone)
MTPLQDNQQLAKPRILGLCGSLRAGSFNAQLLRVAAGLLGPHVRFEIFDGLADLPLYNADLDGEQISAVARGSAPASPESTPLGVTRLRGEIRSADGLVVVTPEYNHAIPGVLKNALDWASRPTTDLPLTGKACVVFVATRGRTLGHRALSDTTRLLTGFANIVVPGPEVVVTSAHERLVSDADGTTRLSDPFLTDAMQKQLSVLCDLIATGAARDLGDAMRKHVPSRWW